MASRVKVGPDFMRRLMLTGVLLSYALTAKGELTLPLPRCQQDFDLETPVRTCYLEHGTILANDDRETKHQRNLIETDVGAMLQNEFRNEPWARDRKRPELGLALSGGGSKTAPFAIGVLKRFIDEGWLAKTDLLSTVSGGGYAAYFLYSGAIRIGTEPAIMEEQRCESDGPSVRQIPRINELFADVRTEHFWTTPTYFDTLDTAKYGKFEPVRDSCGKFPLDTTRHQSFLTCFQDVLSPYPGGMSKNTSPQPLGAYVEGILSTFISLPFHHLANSVFDWKVNLSPSQHVYKYGIGRTYGTTPQPSIDYSRGVPEDRTSSAFDFRQLASLFDSERGCSGSGCVHMPWWIINTTNQVRDHDARDLGRTVFEITPNSLGSGNYGYVIGATLSDLDGALGPLDAVAASAAFFDSLSADPPLGLDRSVIFAGLHLLNLRWGYEIPNFRVGNHARVLRRFLPWPAYYLPGTGFARDANSSYIRLADGGQSGDNLGLFALLRRGTSHIVIADGAHDLDSETRTSRLTELCVASRTLQRHGLDIEFSGFPGDSHACTDAIRRSHSANGGERVKLESICEAEPSAPSVRHDLRECFSPFHWTKRVWAGTVVNRDNHDPAGSRSSLLVGTRIYYIKAAVDGMRIVERAEFYRDKATCTYAETDDLPCGIIGNRLDNTPKDDMRRSAMPCPEGESFIGRCLDNTREDVRYDWRKPETWEWPQGSTVALTADSSANVFKVYRDLGWYLAGALRQERGFPYGGMATYDGATTCSSTEARGFSAPAESSR